MMALPTERQVIPLQNTSDGGLVAAGFDQPDTAYFRFGRPPRLHREVFIPCFLCYPANRNKIILVLFIQILFSETATVILPVEMTGDAAIDIYDVAGQKIESIYVQANINRAVITKNELPCGMYFYHIHTAKNDNQL